MMRDIRRPKFMTGISSRGHAPVLEILIALAVFFVGSIVSGMVQVPAMTVYLLGNREYQSMVFSGRMDMRKTMDILLHVPQWITIVLLLGELGLILAVFLYCRLLEKRKLATLGFCKKGCVSSYLGGLVLGLGLFGAAYVLCLATGSVRADVSALSGNTALYIIGFFLGYLVQGMAEEVLCRGYLMVSLSRRCSVTLSVIVSSLFFAMLHGMNQGVTLLAYINLFLFGVVLALLFLRFENIWIVGALHSAWNFAQGNLFGIRVSGMETQPSLVRSSMTEGWDIVNGGAFGLEGGVAVTLVLSVALALILYSMKRKGCFVTVSRDAAPERNVSHPADAASPDSGAFFGQSAPGEAEGYPQSQKTEGAGNPAGQERNGAAPKEEAAVPERVYENMGLHPTETPWYPQRETEDSDAVFDQAYFRDADREGQTKK